MKFFRRRQSTILVAAIVAALVVGVVLTVHARLTNPSNDPLAFEKYNNAWGLENKLHNTGSGYLYTLTTDCRATFSVTPIIGRPVTPVGFVSGWQVDHDNTNVSKGHCNSQAVNTLFARIVGSRYPFGIGGPWVYSTLPPAAAVAAHVVPTLPLIDEAHPRGYPGYFYEVSRGCVTTWAIRMDQRPLVIHYEAFDGQSNTVSTIASQGSVPCTAPSSQWLNMELVLGFGGVSYWGPWVFTTLGPQAAYKAHLIPTLPQRSIS